MDIVGISGSFYELVLLADSARERHDARGKRDARRKHARKF